MRLLKAGAVLSALLLFCCCEGLADALGLFWASVIALAVLSFCWTVGRVSGAIR